MRRSRSFGRRCLLGLVCHGVLLLVSLHVVVGTSSFKQIRHDDVSVDVERHLAETNADTIDLARRRNKAPSSNVTAIDPKQVHARIPTYRNGYGTSFQCTSTCYFIALAHIVTVAALLALLAVIPVSSPKTPEEAPFLLWFGDKNASTEVRRHGFLDRFAVFRTGSPVVVEHEVPIVEKAEIVHQKEEVPEEVEAVDMEEAPPDVPPKTYESIGVETDDSLLPFLSIPDRPGRQKSMEECVVIEDMDSLFDALPPKSPQGAKKPGIFSPVVSPTHRTSTIRNDDKLDVGVSSTDLLSGSPTARRGSTSPQRRKTLGNSNAGGQESKEDILVAVERRTSLQKRAEKRKEYAKSDIIHENLGDHEVEMYTYLEFVRELLEGITVKKICQKSGKTVKRTFFITPDLAIVYWNKVGSKGWIVKKSSIETHTIDKVMRGLHGNPKTESRAKPDKQGLYLSIVTTDGAQRLDLETKDEGMREQLFMGFNKLAMEKRQEKAKQQQQAATETAQAEGGGITPTPVTLAPPNSTKEFDPSTSEPSNEERRAKSEEDDPPHQKESSAVDLIDNVEEEQESDE